MEELEPTKNTYLWYRDNDAVKLVVGVFFVVVVITLIAFLSFVEVPIDNKPTIMLLMGSLSTAAGFAINNMAGEPTVANEELAKKLATAEKERAELMEDNILLKARCEMFEKRLDELQARLLEKSFH